MTKSITYVRTIVISESGTGSVNLPYPVHAVGDAKIIEGEGELVVEALSTAGCRLMVTGGNPTVGRVTLEFDLTT